MLGRTLITTADERAWPKDINEPVIFLGEWCRRYSRKHVWSKYDAEVVPYHWDDRTKLFNDYQYLTEVYEKFLELLANKLNHIHGVNYSLRYWRILVGPWLGYFIHILFDRWYMLSEALSNKAVSKVRLLEFNAYEFVSNDMSDFITVSTEDDWNGGLYSQIMGVLEGEDVEILWKDILRNKAEPKVPKNSVLRAFLKDFIESALLKYSQLVSEDEYAFFIYSYLPLRTDMKLQMRFGQHPTIWRSQPCPVAQTSIEKRECIEWSELEGGDEFSVVVSKLIPMYLPVVYLEGYQKLRECPDVLHWPISPKFIFTSNAYLSDDIFKQWAAEKTENNIPLVIGQHGGHFGTNLFSFNEKHQIDIADKWLSWGWVDNDRPQIISAGNLKMMGESEGSYNKNGNALMVEMAVARQSQQLLAASISKQWLDYFDEQQRFVNALPDAIRAKLIIRLYSHDYGWSQAERWKDLGYEENIESHEVNIKKLIKDCRVYISTYNATTFIESITWNVPTIMFWNSSHWELNSQAAPYFEKLKAVGVFHETPESAAQQMVKIWNDVDAWWGSNEVQSVRNEFCQQYSCRPENSIEDLMLIFQGLLYQKKEL